MTVKELIELLNTLDGKLRVYVAAHDYEGTYFEGAVRDVIIMPNGIHSERDYVVIEGAT